MRRVGPGGSGTADPSTPRARLRVRRLLDRPAARPRGHGRRLQGDGHRPRSRRGAEAHRAGVDGGRERGGTLQDRGAPGGLARAPEHRAGPPRRRGERRALPGDALRAGDEPAPDDRSQPAPLRDDRHHHHADRRRARRRARARAGAPRRQAGQHPDLRRDGAHARLPHRLRADQASGVDRKPDGDRPVGGDRRLRRPRADPGPRDRRSRRRLLAGLRPLRDADRRGRLPEGRRHRQALGAHQQPAAAAQRGAPRARARLRRRRRQGDGQGSRRSLCDRGRDGGRGTRGDRAAGAGAAGERRPAGRPRAPARGDAAPDTDAGPAPRDDAAPDTDAGPAPRDDTAPTPMPAAPGAWTATPGSTPGLCAALGCLDSPGPRVRAPPHRSPRRCRPPRPRPRRRPRGPLPAGAASR